MKTLGEKIEDECDVMGEVRQERERGGEREREGMGRKGRRGWVENKRQCHKIYNS